MIIGVVCAHSNNPTQTDLLDANPNSAIKIVFNLESLFYRKIRVLCETQGSFVGRRDALMLVDRITACKCEDVKQSNCDGTAEERKRRPRVPRCHPVPHRTALTKLETVAYLLAVPSSASIKEW